MQVRDARERAMTTPKDVIAPITTKIVNAEENTARIRAFIDRHPRCTAGWKWGHPITIVAHNGCAHDNEHSSYPFTITKIAMGLLREPA